MARCTSQFSFSPQPRFILTVQYPNPLPPPSLLPPPFSLLPVISIFDEAHVPVVLWLVESSKTFSHNYRVVVVKFYYFVRARQYATNRWVVWGVKNKEEGDEARGSRRYNHFSTIFLQFFNFVSFCFVSWLFVVFSLPLISKYKCLINCWRYGIDQISFLTFLDSAWINLDGNVSKRANFKIVRIILIHPIYFVFFSREGFVVINFELLLLLLLLYFFFRSSF